MMIERIESLVQLDTLEDEWRELETRMVRLPFVSFDWVQAWWRHLHADSVGVKDELYVRAFRGSRAELRGVVPLMRTRRPGFGPLRLRQLQPFGADPNITEIRGIASAPEDAGDILRALLDHLRSCASEWDFVELTGVPAVHSELVNATGFGAARWVRDVPNYYLPLPATWDEFKSKLSRNIKESLRKCYNAPKRDGLAIKLEVVQSRADARAAVNEFFRLHQARSKLEDTIRHVDVFGAEESRAFLLDVCDRFAARGSLFIFQLKIADAVVATRIGFRCQDTLYLYYSGYDPQYARYSIMTTTVAEAIQFAIAHGFKTVNLSTGNDVSKLRWGPEEAVYRDALLIAPSLRGAIAHESYALVRRQLDGGPLSQARLTKFLSRRA
ncbi:MAG TPA: GNAT family N-acetyltransferase [Polyangiaceae bacterium]|nr:GNAT family N-acetyltransferase [Polyangiaceae bacterium]